MLEKDYPVGHSCKIIKPRTQEENWFGLFQLKILPANYLWIHCYPFKPQM